jgi:hypothetical protein
VGGGGAAQKRPHIISSTIIKPINLTCRLWAAGCSYLAILQLHGTFTERHEHVGSKNQNPMVPWETARESHKWARELSMAEDLKENEVKREGRREGL